MPICLSPRKGDAANSKALKHPLGPAALALASEQFLTASFFMLRVFETRFVA